MYKYMKLQQTPFPSSYFIIIIHLLSEYATQKAKINSSNCIQAITILIYLLKYSIYASKSDKNVKISD